MALPVNAFKGLNGERNPDGIPDVIKGLILKICAVLRANASWKTAHRFSSGKLREAAQGFPLDPWENHDKRGTSL